MVYSFRLLFLFVFLLEVRKWCGCYWTESLFAIAFRPRTISFPKGSDGGGSGRIHRFHTHGSSRADCENHYSRLKEKTPECAVKIQPILLNGDIEPLLEDDSRLQAFYKLNQQTLVFDTVPGKYGVDEGVGALTVCACHFFFT